MALQGNFPDRTGDTCIAAYLIVDLSLDNKTKKGRVELVIWRSREHRLQNKQKINNFCIPIDSEEIQAQLGKPSITYVTQLAWNDFAWRTGTEIYNKVKTLSIKYEDSLIDLSLFTDI